MERDNIDWNHGHDPYIEFDGPLLDCFRELADAIPFCACPNHTPASFQVYLEDRNVPICAKCAKWWKKVNPNATIVTI